MSFRIRNLAVPGLFTVGALYASQVWLYKGFFVDDPFITFRFVKQWTNGNGLVYNVGERVEGYSNFLWTLMLAPFDLLGVDLVLASKLLGIALGLLTVLAIYSFSQRFESRWISALLLVASGPFAAWTVGGLETPLFALLLTLSVCAFVREEDTTRGSLSGILFGLLSLARPEGLGFAAVAVAFRFSRLVQSGSKPNRQDLYRGLGLVMISVPYHLWRLYYYGYLFPNTVYAKSLGLHPRALLEGCFYLYESFSAIGGLFVVALPVALALTGSKCKLFHAYAAANILFFACFVILAGGDWMPMQRFLVHILPLLYLMVHSGLERLREIWPGPWTSSLIIFLAAGQAGYLLCASLENRFLEGAAEHEFLPKVTPTAAYLRDSVGPFDTIAVSAAGQNAYYIPLETRVIDMVGLTDQHIAHLKPQFPSGLFGRGDGFGKWDVDYILAQSPNFVQADLRGRSKEGEWFTQFTGTALLVNDPRFRAAYELPSDDIGLRIFVRKKEN